MKKFYEGICRDHVMGSAVSQKVYVTLASGAKRELKHHVHHSPTGFSWGYHGSGPAELARCILWDHLSFEPHRSLYQKFKVDYIATWPADQGWILGSDAIESWLNLNPELPWRVVLPPQGPAPTPPGGNEAA